MLGDELDEKMHLWPRELRDRVAFVSVVAAVVGVFLFEVLLAIPYKHSGGGYWTAVGLFGWTAANILLNLWKLKTVDPNGGRRDLPTVVRPGYRYCHACQLNAPPRSHHCPVCDVCVSKRDHHSAFAGVCVGYFNQRYYLLLTAYGWLGCLLALWYHWPYVWQNMGGLRPTNFWYMLVPHVAMILRFVSVKQFLLSGVLTTSIFLTGLSTYFLGAQLVCIWLGQTRVEYLLGVRSFDRGPLANMRQVLGPRWYLAALPPLLTLPLDGDGVNFARADDHRLDTSAKDM